MPLPPYGTSFTATGLSVVSRDLLHWDAAWADWNRDTGVLTALTGHAGSWARGVTLASVTDAAGTTYTAQDAEPGWEQRDWDNDTVREAFGLRMGSSDTLSFSASLVPMAMAGLLEMIETGARTTANATLLGFTADAGTGAGIWLDTSGTWYRLNYSDGTTTRTATISSGQPASGDRVRFTWELTGAGALTLKQSINGAAATTATASALTLPATWASGAKWRLNSRGTSANIAQGWYRRVRVVAGALSDTAIVERP